MVTILSSDDEEEQNILQGTPFAGLIQSSTAEQPASEEQQAGAEGSTQTGKVSRRLRMEDEVRNMGG